MYIIRNELQYYLQNLTLDIEIHDRDIIKETPIQTFKKAYLQEEEDKLLEATQKKPEDNTGDGSAKNSAKNSARAKKEKKEPKKKGSDNSAPDVNEVNDLKYIKLYNYESIPEENVIVKPSTDIFSYGICSISLIKILDRSKEIIDNFGKTKGIENDSDDNHYQCFCEGSNAIIPKTRNYIPKVFYYNIFRWVLINQNYLL